GRPGGEDADGPRAEDHDRVVLADPAHFRGLVAGGERIGQHHRVVELDVGRDEGGAHIGERYPHELRLPARIAPRGMRIAVDAADGGRRRIDVVAVAVELALAEVAAAAEDVEGYEDMVALLEPADGRTDLLDDAGELVTDRGADAGVRHEPMVEMKVGAADAGA